MHWPYGNDSYRISLHLLGLFLFGMTPNGLVWMPSKVAGLLSLWPDYHVPATPAHRPIQPPGADLLTAS